MTLFLRNLRLRWREWRAADAPTQAQKQAAWQ